MRTDRRLFTRPYSEWSRLIDEWIFDEKHRQILKRHLLDGKTYEQIAEEVEMSSRQIARIVPELKVYFFKKTK